MNGHRLKASSLRGALAPWRYEVSFNRWIGGEASAFRAFAANLVELAPGESVLDLGCGSGALALRLARRVGPSGRVAGIDLAPALIAGARRKARRAGLAIDFRVASVESLPWADASFDVVVSSFVMHHLSPAVLEHAVSELRRVLKPGGRVVVIDFASLDQAGRAIRPAERHDAHPPAPGGHGAAHGHPHGGQAPHGQHHDHRHAAGHHAHAPGLHDHQWSLVEHLKAVGMPDAHASPVAFGQRLQVTRGRLAP